MDAVLDNTRNRYILRWVTCNKNIKYSPSYLEVNKNEINVVIWLSEPQWAFPCLSTGIWHFLVLVLEQRTGITLPCTAAITIITKSLMLLVQHGSITGHGSIMRDGIIIWYSSIRGDGSIMGQDRMLGYRTFWLYDGLSWKCNMYMY